MSQSQTILIIEDDPDDQDILKHIFTELGTSKKLLFFNDGSEAYNYMMSMEEKPFIIFCDINMPKLNGIELKQKIDSTDHLRRKAIPFIFLTTADNAAMVNQAYQLTNLQGYFRKELLLEDLKAHVKCILEYWSKALHPDG